MLPVTQKHLQPEMTQYIYNSTSARPQKQVDTDQNHNGIFTQHFVLCKERNRNEIQMVKLLPKLSTVKIFHLFSIMCLRRFWGDTFLSCSALCKCHGIDNAYHMHIKVELLIGKMKRITDIISLDGVKEASISSSDIYSLWV